MTIDQRGQIIAGHQVIVTGDARIEQVGNRYYQGLTFAEVTALMVELKRVEQPTVWDGCIPYVGLQAFQESDARYFFGRESLVRELLERVQRSRFIVISGPSGSGKSSVARAGLFHALRAGRLERSESWLLATMRPGSDPVEKLAVAMARAIRESQVGDVLRAEGRANPAVLPQQVDLYLSDDIRQRCLLLVDQFEEIFTQTQNEGLATSFIHLLTSAAGAEAGRMIIVLCVRSDFVSHFARYPELRQAISQQFLLVGAMEPSELVKAITLPALQVGAQIDAALVKRIVDDMKGEPGALPLMSFALRDLFEAAKTAPDRPLELTLEQYLDRGGLEQALERHANQAFAGLTAEQQALARNLFSRLVETGQGRMDTRRTATFAELVPAGTEPQAVRDVIAMLAGEGARMLTTGTAAGDNEQALAEATSPETVTLAHEKLIDAWPWLRRLVDENREAIALQNQIAHDADAWAEQQDTGYLYRGGRLLQVEEKLQTLQPSLDELSQNFIAASLAQRQQEVAEQEAQRERELVHEQALTEEQRKRAEEQTRRVKAIRRALIAIVFLLVLATGAAAYAVLQRNIAIAEGNARATEEAIAAETANLATTREAEALHQAAIAQSQSLAIASQSVRDSNAMTSLLLAIEAGRRQETSLVYGAITGLATIMRRPLFVLDHDACVAGAVWNATGNSILTASYDETSRIWDGNTGKSLLTLRHSGSVLNARWNSDEQLILTNDTAGNATIWHVNRGEKLRVFHHNEEIVYEAYWNNDETLLLTVSGPRLRVGSIVLITYTLMINVWDIDTGELLFSLAAENPTNFIAKWTKGDTRLITQIRSGEISVWDGETWEQAFALPHGASISDVVLSKDERYIITSGGALAKVWNGENGEPLYTLSHGDSISALKVSEDGNYVVTAGVDGIARVWNITGGELLRSLSHGAPISALVMIEDQNFIVTIGTDGAARIWNSDTGELVHTLSHTAPISSASLSEDGSQIVTGDVVGRVKLWNIETSELLADFFHEGRILELELNRLGNRILSTSGDPLGVHCTSTTKIWDSIPESMYITLNHERDLIRAEWNKDESQILTSDSNGNMEVWDAKTGAFLSNVPLTGTVVINGDGNRAITYDTNGRVAIAEIQNGNVLYTLRHDAEVISAMWNVSSSRILTASRDETVRVWNASSGQLLLNLTHGWPVSGASWNSSEDRIMAYDELGFVNIWDATEGELLVSFYRNDGSRGDPIRLYAAKWNEIGDRILTTEETSVVKIWDALTGDLMHDLANAGTQASWDATGQYVLTCCRFNPIASGLEVAKVWNAETGELVFSLPHDYPIKSAIWSKVDSRILTITHDGIAHIWDAEDGKLIFDIVLNGDSVSTAAWSEAGNLLMLITSNGLVHVYPTQMPDMLDAACLVATRNLTWEDWRLYLPGQKYQPTCLALPCDPTAPAEQLALGVCH